MDSTGVRANLPSLLGKLKAGTEMKENFHNSSELVKVLMEGSELCRKGDRGEETSYFAPRLFED